MEQSKFEKDVKEKMQQRTIVPSKKAWGELGNMLDDEPVKNNSKPIFWVAASIVLLIVLNLFFFNRKNSTTPEVVNVIETNEVEKSDKKEDIIVLNDNELVKEITIKSNIIAKDSSSIKYKSNSMVKLKDEVLVDINNIRESKKEELVITFEDQKVNEVVTLIQAIQSKREVTEEEIDELLLKAQKEIDSQRTFFNKTTNKVDAMALLTDVEYELDRSFKDRVLETLKQKIIEAVASTKK